MRIHRNVKIFIILLLSGVGGYLYLIRDFERTSPTLYLNGNFITVNPSQPQAEAMYVADGKIVAIGKQSELEQQYPEVTINVNLRGNYITLKNFKPS